MNIIRSRSSRAALLGVLAATALVTAACGDDDDSGAGVLRVEAVDFGFGDLPDSVEVGTAVELVNTSEVELHELVAVRLPDEETRPAAEIMQGDVEALFAGGPPAMVVLAPPSEADQIVAVGDGTFTEPGRYLIVCMIPTGADPAAYLEAAATSDGPPQVEGGAPHVAHGMFDEILVTS